MCVVKLFIIRPRDGSKSYLQNAAENISETTDKINSLGNTFWFTDNVGGRDTLTPKI